MFPKRGARLNDFLSFDDEPGIHGGLLCWNVIRLSLRK